MVSFYPEVERKISPGEDSARRANAGFPQSRPRKRNIN
jgi:hypothetical protein